MVICLYMYVSHYIIDDCSIRVYCITIIVFNIMLRHNWQVLHNESQLYILVVMVQIFT